MTPFAHAVSDEAQLRQALQDADIVTSLLVHAHLTANTALLDEAAPYIHGAWNYLEKIPEELKTRIRESLIATLKRLAATGQPLVRRLPDDVMKRIMTVGAGQNVPDEYLPLIVEELRFAADDARALQWRRDPAKLSLDTFKVIVIGAGISGICAGIRLQEAGIPFEIYEKNAELGGTWYENDYPDCGVDTANHIYSFSFNPKADWTRHFSKRAEILNYIRDTADKYALPEHIRFATDVESLQWDDDSAQWIVRIRNADGQVQTKTCNAVITAVGLLNRPAVPDIPGLDQFEGPRFHTARWPRDLDISGKRIAMIGTGASGMQAGPAVAPDAASLTVFQRSPHWAGKNPLYHAAISDGQMWALLNIPLFTEWQRFLLFWGSSDGFHASLKIDPHWSQPDLSLNQANHAMREMLIQHIRTELDGDEDLIAKCVPSYPPYGKRMLRDNHWYRMLKRPNVHLVTEPISQVTRDAVMTSDGVTHPADILILATGFHAGKVLWPLSIKGRGGRLLADEWHGDDPRAFLGITIPNFPNFFMTCGPNTGLGHGGSQIFHIECQVKYILQALREMIEADRAALDVSVAAYDRYTQLVDETCAGMVWSHPGVNNWYKNKNNRVTITSPWRLVDYWALTRTFDPSHYANASDAQPKASAAPAT
jgi:4-hydroxyacetophenone monooxygenase